MAVSLPRLAGAWARRAPHVPRRCSAAAATEAPVERSPLDALGSTAPSWGQLQTDHVTLIAASVGKPEAGSAAARALAASRLSVSSALDVMDSPDVMNTYTDAFDGQLEVCIALCDAHLRLLADCLLRNSAVTTTAAYEALARLPPALRRQHTAAAAAVGAAALLHLREDAELLRTMLSLTEGEAAGADEEAQRECAAAAETCRAVDAVIAAMPQPEEE